MNLHHASLYFEKGCSTYSPVNKKTLNSSKQFMRLFPNAHVTVVIITMCQQHSSKAKDSDINDSILKSVFFFWIYEKIRKWGTCVPFRHMFQAKLEETDWHSVGFEVIAQEIDVCMRDVAGDRRVKTENRYGSLALMNVNSQDGENMCKMNVQKSLQGERWQSVSDEQRAPVRVSQVQHTKNKQVRKKAGLNHVLKSHTHTHTKKKHQPKDRKWAGERERRKTRKVESSLLLFLKKLFIQMLIFAHLCY